MKVEYFRQNKRQFSFNLKCVALQALHRKYH